MPKLTHEANPKGHASGISSLTSGSREHHPEKFLIKVLMIDNDEDTFLLTRRMLSTVKHSFQVDWAPSFEEGLETIRRGQHDGLSFG